MEDQIINQRSKIEWTSYLATGIAEGFEESDEPTATIEAWAYITATKLYVELQGWFGRTVRDFIQSGLIDQNGKINWEVYDAKLGN